MADIDLGKNKYWVQHYHFAFQITYSTGSGGASDTNVFYKGNSAYSKDISDLIPGAEYTFKIFARTDAVNSVNGQESEVKKTTSKHIFHKNVTCTK